MNSIELDIMKGMVSILNEASDRYYNGKSLIMTDEEFDVRLADLKEFEDETGVIFISSPNCKIDTQSIVDVKTITNDNFKRCDNASDIVEYSNQREMIAYPDINGSNMIVTYTDGILTSIQIDDAAAEERVKSLNLPYKIKANGDYVLKGKATFTNKLTFYVSDILKGSTGNLADDLKSAEAMNFNIVPFWLINDFNLKTIDWEAIDYAIDFIEDNDLNCDGMIFKHNEKQFSNVLNFVGCYYNR